MGYYLNSLDWPADGKTEALLAGATEIFRPPKKVDPTASSMLICVVRNFSFDAAAFIYSEAELRAFNDPKDPRPHNGLLLPRELAERW
jgi:hypothetical protein